MSTQQFACENTKMLTPRVLIYIFAISHVAEATLTIGAFNIQRLSDSKMEDPTILKQVAQILVRFDVATIEEVIHPDAMRRVLEEVNRVGGPYHMTMSGELGRSVYKEHLAIIYRTDKVRLRNHVTYPDHEDAFEREPFSALFHTIESSVTTFGLMGVHLRPDGVREEIDALARAYEHAAGVFHTKNFIIAGDFNADCRYLSNRAYHNTVLWNDDRFTFLVDTDADSTASHNTDCAYDRFVVTGAIDSAVVSGSVRVYNFETGLHLSYEEALGISDHYPIQMQLQ
ncbi:deoxyribonuclease-1-like 2 isoform X2 [Babylonia areolata]|uniref:deoxyribonuclease-1-like 2 isoform X2 n=1 Tax=Babylonia areolata TaxID=304850 RepID=UPI003FD5C620